MTKKTSDFMVSDADLSTPKHDAICLWVQAEVKAARLFQREAIAIELREGFYRSQGASKYDSILAWERQHARPATETKVLWEQPIYTQQDTRYRRLVGYVDLVVQSTVYTLATDRDAYCWSPAEIISYVEVKSSIPSLGELLRQLSSYRAYIDPRHLLWVVSPDARFADHIREQGHGFIEAPAEVCGTLKGSG